MHINRRILAALMVIGMVAAVAGSTTMALFSDTETSQDNTFAAGSVDLKIDWNESYNGELIEEQPLTDNPGPIFNINDVKPGDQGEATVSLHVFGNPAFIDMMVNQTGDRDNSCTEPEIEAESDCLNEGTGEGTGELGQHLQFMIWYDDGDNVKESGETVIFNGTAHEMDAALSNGMTLDADTSTDQIDPYVNSTTRYIGIQWMLPRDTGNEVQTDSKTFDISFTAEQARNNEREPVPQEEDAFYQVDLAEGQVIQDLSTTTYNSRGDMLAWFHGAPGTVMGNESVANQGDCSTVDSDASNVFDVDTTADEATAHFEVTQDNCTVTLAAYEKPFAGWIASRADEQVVFDSLTETLDTGTYSRTVDIPNVN